VIRQLLLTAAEEEGEESEIHIGTHLEWDLPVLGTVNGDTVISTLVAGTILLLLGFWVRSLLTKQTADHVPTKIQMVWEGLVKYITELVENNLGKVNPFVIPLAVALFFFILIANWLEVITTEQAHNEHFLPPPTADTNLTYAMAAIVIVGVWVFGIRENGLKGYLKHFVGLSVFPEKKVVDIPVRIAFTGLNILEELVKPITLALRLFGNIFAGGIMLLLIAMLPSYALWAPNVVWKLFGLFIGGLQAFIFALLTVLYFGHAAAHHDSHDDEKTDAHDEVGPEPARPVSEPELVH
jgi:F-type H+-transporting ATPase subunit a